MKKTDEAIKEVCELMFNNQNLIYDALNNSPEFSRYIIRSLSEIIARTIVQVKMYKEDKNNGNIS